jgi:hypothetical protein
MLLGGWLSRLRDQSDAASLLDAVADVTLFAELGAAAEAADETPAEYVRLAVERFANLAGDQDWVSLKAALDGRDPPLEAALGIMLRWALKRDAAACGQAAGVGGGGHHARL